MKALKLQQYLWEAKTRVWENNTEVSSHPSCYGLNHEVISYHIHLDLNIISRFKLLLILRFINMDIIMIIHFKHLCFPNMIFELNAEKLVYV